MPVQEKAMKSKQIIVAIVVLLVMGIGIAQAKPNFSGSWKMNIAKSEFGPMPPPSSVVQKITHNDPKLTVDSTSVGERGEFTTNYAYTTDGKECVNQIRNFEMKSTVKWDGDTLVIESKMDFQGNAATMSEKWTLSEDGKTLTVNRHFSSPQGEGDAKSILEKQ